MNQRIPSAKPVPPALQKQGITGAIEVAPFQNFRVKGLGHRLAVVFGEELLRRLQAERAHQGSKPA